MNRPMFKTLGRWFPRQCGQGRPVAAASRATRRLQLEWLEDRTVPATFDVTNTADILNQAGTLRNAIQQANSNGQGNTISILTPGTYAITLTGTPNESDNAAGEFAINLTAGQTLTISNDSGGAVVIDAQGNSRVFDINPSNTALATPSSVTFKGNSGGLTITNGQAADALDATGDGGDIRAQGAVDLTLNNVTVSNGSGGEFGGGISMTNTVSTPWMLTLNNSTVRNNHVRDNGGGINEEGSGTVVLNNSFITGNSAENNGGGVYLFAINAASANLNVTGTYIAGNFAGGLGGGIANSGNGLVTITQSTLEGNFADNDGGGFDDSENLGGLLIANSLFLDNSTGGHGGAIAYGGPGSGGTQPLISNTQIQGNFAHNDGGGLYFAQNSNGANLTANVAYTIQNSTIADNTTNGDDGGGGIQLTTNPAQANGFTTAITLVNSTLAGNTASANGAGIDFDSGFTGSLKLQFDTITGNLADFGGGLNLAGAAGSTLSIQNTIVANNSATAAAHGPDVFVAANGGVKVTDLGNNRIGLAGAGNGNSVFNGPNDLFGPFTDLVAGLTNNGGPTVGSTGHALTLWTEALPPNSPARNKGLAIAGITTDERGDPDATPPDVGAFQFQNADLTLTITAPPTLGLGSSTLTVTVNNTSANALPADNGTVVVTLPAGLTAASGGQTQTFTLGAIAANQSQSFALPVNATQTGAQTVSAFLTSPDANDSPVAKTVTVTVSSTTPTPPSAPTPQGQLLVFGLGIDNGQVVLLFVDQAGQVFDESFSFANFFTPNPANATLLNSDLVFQNLQPTTITGSPGLLGNILDASNNAIVMTTVPLNFISSAALNDIIHALQQPGA